MSRHDIKLKSANDIAELRAGGKLLAQILQQIVDLAVVGAVPKDLDRKAQELIAQASCTPAFLNYGPKGHPPFPAALCVSINDGLVHGLPSDKPLENGDVVGLDLGLVYKNKYYLDHARTVVVGEDIHNAQPMIDVAQKSMELGIEQARVGNKIGDISSAIQKHVEDNNFSIIRDLVGHGVGFEVHEDPQVPNFGEAGDGPVIEPGLVIAIEPMIAPGDPEVKQADDGWTIAMASGELSAHVEHTVAITEEGPEILTKL